MIRSTLLCAAVPALLSFAAAAICPAAVEKLSPPDLPVMKQRAVAENWELPGARVRDILDLINTQGERLQRSILAEAWRNSAWRRELPLSLDRGNRVFASPDIRFSVEPAAPAAAGTELHCEVRPYFTRHIPRLLQEAAAQPPQWRENRRLAHQREDFAFRLASPGVYTLRISRVEGGRETALRTVYFAVAYDRPLAAEKNAPVCTAPADRPVATQYFLMKAPVYYAFPGDPDQAFRQFREEGYDGVHVAVHWDDLEIFPGGYDFRELDRLVKAAEKNRLVIEFFIFYQVHRVPFQFWAGHMVDQHGKLSNDQGGRFRITPTMESRLLQESYNRMIAAMIRHYDSHPNVLSYHLSLRNTEWGYPGVARNRQVFDYSADARRGFAKFLQQRYGTPERAAASHGTPYASWDEVTLPLPRFGETDLSRRWWDFIDYKLAALRDNAEKFSAAARSHTAKTLIFYNDGGFGPLDNLLPIFARNGITGGACSTNLFYGPLFTDIYRERGLKMYHEPANLNRNAEEKFFFNMLRAGNTVREIGGIINFETPHKSREERRNFNRLLKVLPYMYHQDVAAPLCIYFSFDTMLNSSKAFDLNTWSWGLIKPLYLGLFYTAFPFASTTDYSNFDLSRYRLVVDSGSQVLRAAQIDRLVDYVRNGGNLVIFPDTGRYCVDRPGEAFPLLRRFGLAAPMREKSQPRLDFTWNRVPVRFEPGAPFRAPVGWEVWAGTPQRAIVAAGKFGRGRLILTAGTPPRQQQWHAYDRALLQAPFFEALAAQFPELTRPVTPDRTAPVRYHSFIKNGRRYLAVFNDAAEPVAISLRLNFSTGGDVATDVITSRRYALEKQRTQLPLTVAPHALMLLEFLPPGSH